MPTAGRGEGKEILHVRVALNLSTTQGAAYQNLAAQLESLLCTEYGVLHGSTSTADWINSRTALAERQTIPLRP